jgi:hypothetical protein
MLKIKTTAFAMAMVLMSMGGASANTFVCTTAADAEAIVAAAVAEPSLELGQAEVTTKLIDDKIAGGLCAKAELDVTLDGVDMRPAADGIRLGVARINVGYAVVADGILDF